MQAHPRYRELVEQGFAAASFVGDLGIRPLDCGPGWVEAGLDILPRHAQQNGFIHAGVQATLADHAAGAAAATLADHAAGAAAATLVEEGQTVLTLEFKLNLLRPALCQRLLCRAEVLKAGRQVTVVEAEVFAERDGRRRLFSKATVTMAVVALAE
ncbi:PaaI family thioesterase [Pseudomonas aeruginosa]|uniref:PaaI family thioesterase n=4 Tax=Pseudomonas aeruginosa TaxID=287 RepID=UPI00053DB0B0|nr:PaaI family thioesterase [Pseudomonas aeruginosa]SCZ09827.1 Putative esterase [Acinetobacter baumannii]ASJ83318.1 thioesterase superfamily protein [Pseudomonas aeruginosa]AVJ91755.1 thioesterase family protein [Pseudomonas aeruginosa]AVK28274.1 thioesterase family protein [Pseudomonas aeruginosa]AWE80815.1 thioesterase family protein [Pseudomonas aeruginosa]